MAPLWYPRYSEAALTNWPLFFQTVIPRGTDAMKLHELTIEQASDLLKNKEITSVELTRAVLDRIAAVDGKVGAFLTVDADGAMAQAEAADHRLARGDTAPLTGIPLGIKDLICTQGLRTTCASKMLENFIPPYDATVIAPTEKSRGGDLGQAQHGRICHGLHHRALRLSDHPQPMESGAHPGRLQRRIGRGGGGGHVPGCPGFGYRRLHPPAGLPLRRGRDQADLRPGIPFRPGGLCLFPGPDRTVGQKGDRLRHACWTPLPVTTPGIPPPSPNRCRTFTAIADDGLVGCRGGHPQRLTAPPKGLDPEVGAAVERAVKTIESLGARCIDVALPHTDHAVAAYYVIAPSEASSNLARYDGVKYGFRDKSQADLLQMYRSTRSQGFGPEVQRRIILGTYALSAGYYDAYYGKASQIRTLIMNDFQTAFASCDAIVSPVAPTPAFPIGKTLDDPLTMYLSDIFTLSANLAGIPGISVPCGFSDDGLPIGLQIMGRHFNEAMLFKIAREFEKAANIKDRRPPL